MGRILLRALWERMGDYGSLPKLMVGPRTQKEEFLT